MEQLDLDGDIHLLVAAMVQSTRPESPLDTPAAPSPPPPTAQPQVPSPVTKKPKKVVTVRIRCKRDSSPDDDDDVLISRRKAFRRGLYRPRPGMANPTTGEGYKRVSRFSPPHPPPPSPQPIEFVSRESQTRPLAIPRIPVASRTFPAPWRRRVYMPLSLHHSSDAEDNLPYIDDSLGEEIASSDRILEGMVVVDASSSGGRTVATNTASIGRRKCKTRRPRRRYFSRVEDWLRSGGKTYHTVSQTDLHCMSDLAK